MPGNFIRLKSLHGLWRRVLACGLMAAASAGVVFLYQRPEMLIQLSDQLWACF